MPQAPTSYHHGDLRSACVQAAIDLLNENGNSAFSLRAVAERIGVSPAAPYRHYSNKEALIAAVATIGYRNLAELLESTHPAPASIEDLAAVGVTYVQFALQKPALFRLMFGEPCQSDDDDTERQAAVAVVATYLCSAVQRCFPQTDAAQLESLTHAIWALVHGLAVLHLAGKFTSIDSSHIDAHIRQSILALWNTRDTSHTEETYHSHNAAEIKL